MKSNVTCINESMISHAWTEPLTSNIMLMTDDWDKLFPFALRYRRRTNSQHMNWFFERVARMTRPFPHGPKFRIYGSYLRDLILRLTKIQKIAARNLIGAKQRSKCYYDAKARRLNGKLGDQVYKVK